MTPWEIDALELGNCNCNYGCPCQFSVAPTHGTCEAAVVMEIQSGFYGDTDLSGIKFAQMLKWPGAIHEGNGEMQLVIEETASEDQRNAITAITTGKDTEEMATVFYIFSAMCPTKHETIYSKIDSDLNLENRVGQASINGVMEIKATPIAHIVSGEPHRIGLTVPYGFEFRHAEMASGTTKTFGGNIELLNNSETHAHFARIYMNGQGVINH